MRKTIMAVALALTMASATAQDFTYAKPTPEEFNVSIYQKDTSANAVVLNEFGTAYVSDEKGDIIFDYHVKIKIFNSKGFKYGDVEIPLRKGDANNFETIRDIKGVTYYPDEDKLIRKTELDPAQIFSEKKAGKYHDLKKFAMPNLRDGCIIEYRYTIVSPYIRNFRQWDFQWDIPKIYSEFIARIPAIYNYNIVLRGPFKLTKNTGVAEKECFSPGGGFKADCSKITYAMADIPAFLDEDYMTAASNFKSAMYFELSDYVDFSGGKHNLSKEWKDVDRDLKTEEWFGVQLKKTDFFEDKMALVTTGKTSELAKAQSIYSHFQNWFKWNNYYGKYSDQGIRKAYESRSGSAADINLALVTAMKAAGLNAEPIILSTRANGLLTDLYPVLSEFDYVIGHVTIDEKYYLLDATDPLLPFGLLPLRCINDKGRIMSFNKPSAWIDLKASQKEQKTISFLLNVEPAGSITGTMHVVSAGYEAYNKRLAISKFSSIEDYVEDLDERFPKIKFTKSNISNLDSLDKQLIESYEIEIKSQEGNKVNISPFLMNRITTNPFKLLERTYPVDMGTLLDTKVILTLTFPPGFNVAETPQKVALALPNNGGKLITQTSVEGNVLSLAYYLQLNKSIYSSEEYYYLKEFYNKIIETQQADIVLKKKL